jgi:16S rRNA (guanine966-N2)-methyltransferase
MRIIAGTYRGRILKSPPSLNVRPTSDRFRETLFNVLAPRIVDVRFLDLCAGSGAVGIEALSRGARHATFVDKSRKMCGLIEANLDLLKVPEDETQVVNEDAAEFLRHSPTRKRGPWDIVFFDPPYAEDYSQVLRILGSSNELLSPDALVIAEHHHKQPPADEFGNFGRIRILKQGDSALSFYSLQPR